MKVDWVPLGDVLEVVRRAVVVEPGELYTEVGVRSFGKGVFLKSPVEGASLGNKKVYRIFPGDLVVSNVFAWEGAVGIAGPECDGTIGSHRFITLRPRDGGKVLPEFVCHYLLSNLGIGAMGHASPGSAGRNRTLALKALERIEIPLPPLADQRRIAAHLDSVGVAASVVPGVRQSVRSVLQGVLGEATKGAADLPVSQLVDPVFRKVPVVADQRYEMMGVRWYGEGAFARETRRGDSLSVKSVFEVKAGDLVYNRLFAWKESFALVDHEGMHASGEFPTFRVKSGIVLPEVLLALLLAPAFTRQVDAASSGSTPTSRNRLKVPDFLRLTVPIPSPRTQAFIRRELEVAGAARKIAKRAEGLHDALLPAARNEVFSQLTR